MKINCYIDHMPIVEYSSHAVMGASLERELAVSLEEIRAGIFEFIWHASSLRRRRDPKARIMNPPNSQSPKVFCEMPPFSTPSVVVSCFNDSEVLPKFQKRLLNPLERPGSNWKVIFVDDPEMPRFERTDVLSDTNIGILTQLQERQVATNSKSFHQHPENAI
jgi:hypothetical protein